MRLVTFLLLIGCGSRASTGRDSGDEGDPNTPVEDDTSARGDDTAVTEEVLTGTLGDLGALQPIVAANVIEYSGETITYLSTVPLPCEAMAQSRWLGSLDTSAQIVELVYKSATTGTHLEVGGNGQLEVNYAMGGRSSSYEEGAVSGTVDLDTEHQSGTAISGTVDATFRNPAGELHGPFAAEFCPGGQEY